MWIKIVLLVSISLSITYYGIRWFSKSFSADLEYDFREDVKRSFFVPHLKYSGFFNDGKPRRIVPVLMIIGGIGIMVIGLIKIL